MDAEIVRLKADAVAKKAEADKQAAERKAREPSAKDHLTGKDLQAWRTDYVVADKRCRAFNEIDEEDAKQPDAPTYANRKIVVRVVDYGAEMGVEAMKITTEPKLDRHHLRRIQ